MELVIAFVLGMGLLLALAEPETLEEQAERISKDQERQGRARA